MHCNVSIFFTIFVVFTNNHVYIIFWSYPIILIQYRYYILNWNYSKYNLLPIILPQYRYYTKMLLIDLGDYPQAGLLLIKSSR